jgi:ketosteroid isomerase-like protein
MASANVELVRSIYAEWERGDFSSAEWADPGIELVYADGPEPGHWTGLAEMANAWLIRLSAFDDFRFVVDRFREIDGERVLVLWKATGRAKTSGLALDQMPRGGVHVWYVRDGKVTRLVDYGDRDRALADVGLAPEREAADRLD